MREQIEMIKMILEEEQKRQKRKIKPDLKLLHNRTKKTLDNINMCLDILGDMIWDDNYQSIINFPVDELLN